MRITPISNNYYNYRTNKTQNNNTSKPNFKGALNDIEMKNNLNMLRGVISGVIYSKDINGLKETADKLASKYANWGIDSIGMMIVPEKDLNFYSNGKVKEEDGAGKIGIFVATGDKRGPVETWGVAYESKLVVLPKSVLTEIS